MTGKALKFIWFFFALYGALTCGRVYGLIMIAILLVAMTFDGIKQLIARRN